MVGYPYYYDPTTPVQAAVWDRATLTNLDPLPGHPRTFAFAINSSGQVAGESCESDNVECHNVIWNGVTPTDLGASGGGAVLAINDSAQLAGFTCFHPDRICADRWSIYCEMGRSPRRRSRMPSPNDFA